MTSLLMISVLDVNEGKLIYYGGGTVFFLLVFFNIVIILFVPLILVKLGEKKYHYSGSLDLSGIEQSQDLRTHRIHAPKMACPVHLGGGVAL